MRASLATALFAICLGSASALISKPEGVQEFLKEQYHAAKADQKKADNLNHDWETQFMKAPELMAAATRDSQRTSDQLMHAAEKATKAYQKDMQTQFTKAVKSNEATQKHDKRSREKDGHEHKKVTNELQENFMAGQKNAAHSFERAMNTDARKHHDDARSGWQVSNDLHKNMEASHKKALFDDEKGKKELMKATQMAKKLQDQFSKDTVKANGKNVSHFIDNMNKAASDFWKTNEFSKNKAVKDLAQQFTDKHAFAKVAQEQAHHKHVQDLAARKRVANTISNTLRKGQDRVANHLMKASQVTQKHALDLRNKLAHEFVKSGEDSNKHNTPHALLRAQERALKEQMTPEMLTRARELNQQIAFTNQKALEEKALARELADHASNKQIKREAAQKALLAAEMTDTEKALNEQLNKQMEMLMPLKSK